MNAAVILTAGTGSRMKLGKNKLLHEIGKPLLSYCVETFQEHELIDEIIVVAREDEINEIRKITDSYNKVKAVIAGGKERQDSSYNGVMHADSDVIVIHDGARAFVNKETITRTIKGTKETGACIAAVPSKDTIKVVEKRFVKDSLKRDTTWIIQTPQAFKYDIIKEAHEKAREDRFMGTDESMLVERLGKRVKVVLGSYDNFKITTPEDMMIAKKVIQNRHKNTIY